MSAPKDTSTSEGPAKGPSPSGALIGGAVAALNSGCWQERDALSIAEAVVGERSLGGEYDALIALMPDELQPAVRDALPEAEASPNPQGLMWIVRQADGYRRDLRALDGGDAPDTPREATFRIVPASEITGDNLPPLPPALVDGLMRVGGKLLVVGAAKSHKSMELIHLSLALATGGEWFGHRCRGSRVLYVNVELSPAEFAHRVQDVADKMGLAPRDYGDRLSTVSIAGGTIGGQAVDMHSLREWLTARCERGEFDVIVFDPIYKFSGDESHEAVNGMLMEFDRLRNDLGCSIAYSAHVAKGGGAGRTVFEAARGSGDFGNDADAVVSIQELSPLKEGSEAWDEATRLGIPYPETSAYRIAFGCRSFADPPSLDAFKCWPLFVPDEAGVLAGAKLRGAPGTAGGEATASKSADLRERKDRSVSEAVIDCKSMGEAPTREAVYRHMATTCPRNGIERPSMDTLKSWTSRQDGLTHWRPRRDASGEWLLSECYREPDGRATYRDGEPLFLPKQSH